MPRAIRESLESQPLVLASQIETIWPPPRQAQPRYAPLEFTDRAYGRMTASPRKKSHPLSRRARPPSSILPFDVLLHAPPHLDQTAPDLLKKGNHLVDVRIAGQLELRIVGLCGGWTRRTGYG